MTARTRARQARRRQIQRGGALGHPPVGQIAERLHHRDRAAGEQQVHLIGRRADLRQAHRQRAAGPAVERHVRQHRLECRVALRSALGRCRS